MSYAYLYLRPVNPGAVPGSIEIRFLLGMAYLQAGRQKAAREEFQWVARRDPAGPRGREARKLAAGVFP